MKSCAIWMALVFKKGGLPVMGVIKKKKSWHCHRFYNLQNKGKEIWKINPREVLLLVHCMPTAITKATCLLPPYNIKLDDNEDYDICLLLWLEGGGGVEGGGREWNNKKKQYVYI